MSSPRPTTSGEAGGAPQSPLRRAWSAIEPRSRAWAFKALDDLADSLTPEVRGHLLTGEKEAYVVVFGKTQVGKTTLILELMGVLPASLPRVSQSLRGGRPSGKSATATAMEYGRSRDERWLLQEGGGEIVAYDDDSISAALADVRDRMMRQRLNVEHPVRVAIPADCFAKEASCMSVRMLDLPGDHAAAQQERHHVKRVAERLVPGADLVLLVGRVDDLSFARPGTLNLPGIADWEIIPNRFRIITTYSFTAKSMHDQLRRAAPGQEIAVARTSLLKELATFGAVTSRAFAQERLFPLELGDSMAALSTRNPVSGPRVVEVVDSLKKELLATVSTATTPLARLGAALDIHLVVAEVKQASLTALHGQRKELAESLAEANRSSSSATQARRRSESRVQALEEKRDRFTVSPARIEAEVRSHAKPLASMQDRFDDKQKSVQKLKDGLLDFRTAVHACFHAPLAIHAKTAEGSELEPLVAVDRLVPIDKIDNQLDEHLDALDTRLGGYWVERYLWNSSFERDLHDIRHATRLVVSSLEQEATAQLTQLVATTRRFLTTRCGQARREFVAHAEREEHEKQELAKVKRRVSKLDKLITDTEVRMSGDMKRCEAFRAKLDDEYVKALRAARRRIATAPPALAFVELLTTRAMKDARTSLLQKTMNTTAPRVPVPTQPR